jgi:hypothetical protein
MNGVAHADALVARGSPQASFATSLAIFASFAAAVFLIQGSQPQLGSDHLSYIGLADSMRQDCPEGDYWREANSIRMFGVILAYLHAWTGSHVLSMKLVLAICTILYLIAAEAFFALFARSRWQALLFALLSAFAVSFGVSSWGVTDSTALLPRTLVAPVIMAAFWLWFRFDGRPAKYLAVPLLVAASVLHLSTFYALGVLALVELWDLAVLAPPRRLRLAACFAAAVVASGGMLFALELTGISSRMIGVQVPEMLRALGFHAINLEWWKAPTCHGRLRPSTAAVGGFVRTAYTGPHAPRVQALHARVAADMPATPKQAWDVELRLRPWRNMPLPLVNVANVLSSSALILALGLVGLVRVARNGPSRPDRLMMAMFVAVPLLALGPQTLMWTLRSFAPVYPVNLEEVRAIGLIMVPAFYFTLRLFMWVTRAGSAHPTAKAAAIVVLVLVLPLFMKNLPRWARESALAAMASLHIVDPSDESRMANARTALGLSASSAPFYYATEGVRRWIEGNTSPGSRILTNRDDMILLRHYVIIGPRQVGATTYYATPEMTALFLDLSQAIASKDTARVAQLGKANQAHFAVVPWTAPGAVYSDPYFSVIDLRNG